jgi:glycerol-3-phosphate dehydrogenase
MEIAQLGPEQRAQALRQMTEQIFDVVVIGGGVTGAGTALDAASRGLSVALLEKEDLASGTSSRSGKTFHGGLRYLQQLNFPLVRQAAHERNLMVDRLCPHLTRPTPFLFLSRCGGSTRSRVWIRRASSASSKASGRRSR